jgi:hypothetical protein
MGPQDTQIKGGMAEALKPIARQEEGVAHTAAAMPFPGTRSTLKQ